MENGKQGGKLPRLQWNVQFFTQEKDEEKWYCNAKVISEPIQVKERWA